MDPNQLFAQALPLEPPQPPPQEVTPPVQTREIREIPQAIDMTGWADKTLLLGDRDLLEFSNGELITLIKDWYQREPSSGDEIVFLPESKVFAISGGRQSVDVIRPNGYRLGSLTLSSGGEFDGYVADEFSQAIYVKEYNLESRDDGAQLGHPFFMTTCGALVERFQFRSEARMKEVRFSNRKRRTSLRFIRQKEPYSSGLISFDGNPRWLVPYQGKKR